MPIIGIPGPPPAPTDCDPFTLSQDDLLAVLPRVLAANWLDPIMNGENDGWELFRGYAKMWERVSLAVGRFECASYISSAHGAARATLEVQFLRPSAAAGPVTVKIGTLVKASTNGALYRVLADVFFDVGELGPFNVTVESIGYGHEYNTLGPHTTPNGETMPGEIDTIDLPLYDPPFGDTSIYVQQYEDAVGGSEAALDLYGEERDLRRNPGEADEAYALRIRTVPDVVTPAAVRRQIDQFMKGLGYTSDDWYLVETWEHRFQECYDAPEASYVFQPDYNPDLFAFDDPRDPSPIRNRYYDRTILEGAFILEIPSFPCVDDHSYAFDDTVELAGELLTALGRRATPAPDIPDDPVSSISTPCYDGVDLALDALHLRLWTLLDETKAHGVTAVVHAKGE